MDANVTHLYFRGWHGTTVPSALTIVKFKQCPVNLKGVVNVSHPDLKPRTTYTKEQEESGEGFSREASNKLSACEQFITDFATSALYAHPSCFRIGLVWRWSLEWDSVRPVPAKEPQLSGRKRQNIGE